MANTKESLSTSVKLGIVLGLLYCVLILCQNQFFYSNPIQFASAKILCYGIILIGIFYTGVLRKKELGGYITFQECLKSMLLAITILELFYLIFSTVYIKYIDAGFFEKLKTGWQAFFIKNNMPEDKIHDSLEKFNEAHIITVWGLIQSYGFAIIIDAVFAVIFAAFLKKQNMVIETHT